MMEQNKHRKEFEKVLATMVNDVGIAAASPEGRDFTKTAMLINIASNLADIADILCAGKESKEEDE